MRKVLLLATICAVGLCYSCRRTGLKKYYTKISPEEFASYDSTIKVLSSKYGIIYRAYTQTQSRLSSHSEINFLVFKKSTGVKSFDLFKLDESTEMKDDSTFIFYGDELKISADTSNWVNGLWFYQKKTENESAFSVDSMPKNLLPINYQQLAMGIYRYDGKKLVRISNVQSDEAFSKINLSGFFYLPNPGRFYTLANFKQIE